MSYQNKSWGGSAQQYKRCYETHPALSLGSGVQVYGGSCSSPIITDADVYVGLDLSIKKSTMSYPWEPGESFLFYIQDMHAPADAVQFKKLIDWLAVQLTAQKKVHIGCIGGHGRTGTVLAALTKVMTGEVDAIGYVRENYCKKAVESHEQVAFLMKHFGINNAVPAKSAHGGSHITPSRGGYPTMETVKQGKVVPLDKRTSLPAGSVEARPAKHQMSIWGSEFVFDKP